MVFLFLHSLLRCAISMVLEPKDFPLICCKLSATISVHIHTSGSTKRERSTPTIGRSSCPALSRVSRVYMLSRASSVSCGVLSRVSRLYMLSRPSSVSCGVLSRVSRLSRVYMLSRPSRVSCGVLSGLSHCCPAASSFVKYQAARECVYAIV